MVSLNKSNEELCLFNYYAIELLNSAGNGEPTQKEISAVENNLKKPENYFFLNTLLKILVSKKPVKGKILLIESNNFFRYVHYILLSNFGFLVETANCIEEVVEKKDTSYFAIFSRLNQEKINGWMAARIFENLPEDLRPKIYLLLKSTEDEIIKEHFLKRGVQGIFGVPLNTWALDKEFNEFFIER